MVLWVSDDGSQLFHSFVSALSLNSVTISGADADSFDQVHIGTSHDNFVNRYDAIVSTDGQPEAIVNIDSYGNETSGYSILSLLVALTYLVNVDIINTYADGIVAVE